MKQIGLSFLLILYTFSIDCQSIKELIQAGSIIPEQCVQFKPEQTAQQTILINLSSKQSDLKINNLDGFNKIVETMQEVAAQHSPRSKRKKSVPPSIDWSLFSIELDLSHNHLTSLHEDSFISFCSRYPLHNLDVSYNNIKSLDQKHFASNVGLSSLKSCSFGHNHIDYIPKDFLQNALSLASLDLSHNQLNQKMVERIGTISATKPSLTKLKLNDRKKLKKHADQAKDDETRSNSDGSLEISIGK